MITVYKKSGSAGIKGIDFQIGLSTIFLLNALRKLTDWRLSTENQSAGKFDDLVLELTDKGAILLQAKFKDNKKITLDQILSTNSKSDDFSLPKYFFSYQLIKEKFNVNAIIICINTDVDKGTVKILNRRRACSHSILHCEDDYCWFYTIDEKILPKLKENINIYRKNNLKGKGFDDILITDKLVKDFLKQLQLYCGYPSGKEMQKVIQRLLSHLKSSNDLWCDFSSQDVYSKVKDWFQQKRGVYLTEIGAKALFCDIKSDNYCESLNAYNVRFKHINFDFSNPKRIIHITSEDGYLLQVIKVYQSLQNSQIKTLYICPEDGIVVLKQVIEAFQLPQYTFLILVEPKITGDAIKGICCQLKETLDKFEYKKVILISECDNKLAKNILITNKAVDVHRGTITFENFSKETQEKLLKKKNVMFQGKLISLEELFVTETTENYEIVVSSEIIEKLFRDEVITMGSEVRSLDDHIACYYINRIFERKIEENDKGEDIETFFQENISDVNEKIILLSDSAGMGKSTVLTKIARDIKERKPHLWVIRIDLNDYTKVLNVFLRKNKKTINIIDLLNSKNATKLNNNLEKFVFSISGKVVLMLDGVDEISPDYTELILGLLTECREASNFSKIFVTTRLHMVQELKEHLCVAPFSLQPFTVENREYFLTSYWRYNLELDHADDQEKCKQYAKALIKKMSLWIDPYEEIENHFAAIPLHVMMLAEVFQQNTRLEELTEWQGCKEYLSSDSDEPDLPENVDMTELYSMFMEKKRDIFLDKGNSMGNTSVNQALINEYENCLVYHRTLALEVMLFKNECELFLCYKEGDKNTETNMLKIGIAQKLDNQFNFIHRTFAEYFLAQCVVKELELQNPNADFQKLLIEEIFSNDEFSTARAFINSFLQRVVDAIPSTVFKNYQSRTYKTDLDMSLSLIHNLAREGCTALLKLIFKCIRFQIIRDKEISVNKLSTGTFVNAFIKTKFGNTLKVLQFLTRQGGVDIKDINERTPLQEAVWNNRLGMTTFLVEQGGNIKGTDDDGFTLIYKAIVGNHVEIVRYFLEIMLKTNTKDIMIPFMAAFLGRLDIITQYLKEWMDVNRKSENGETLIFGAVRGKQRAIIDYLARQGANLNFKNNDGNTALCLAVSKDHLDIVECLVELGADPNIKKNDGRTALHLSARWGNLETVKYLVKFGANVFIKENEGHTALHLAARWGHFNTMNFLQGYDEDIHKHDNNREAVLRLSTKKSSLDIINLFDECGVGTLDDSSRSVLHLSALRNRHDIIEYLIDLGVDVNIRDYSGDTALHLVAQEGHLGTVKLLIKHGADINLTNHKNHTALHLSILRSQWEVVKYLVELDANLNIETSDGYTALHLVAQLGHLETIKLIATHGASTTARDSKGSTALHLAAATNRCETVRFFLEEMDVNMKDNDGCIPLHLAIKKGHLDTVKLLCKQGSDLNLTENNGKTALHLAARWCNLDTVKLLVEYGADINITNNNGQTALHLAALKGKLHTVEFLLKLGVDVNLKDINGCTPLHSVVEEGYKNIAQLLVANGADINVIDNNSHTALHLAALWSQRSMIEYFLELGINVNIKDHDGCTALHLVVEDGVLDTIKLMTEHGADINAKNNNNQTALHLAALWGRRKTIKHLVELGIDLDVKDNDGCTGLHIVTQEGCLSMVKWLVDHGANKNATNDNGHTALHLAILWDQDYTIEILVKLQVDVNIRDNNGCTALHLLVEEGHLDNVKMIVENGADLNVQDKNGHTALHLAVLWFNVDIIEYLLQVGANVSLRDNAGCTVLHLIVEKGHLNTVKLLIKYGADVNATDSKSRTVLHLAVENPEMVGIFLGSDPDMNIRDSDNRTALHYAASKGLNIVKQLIEHGANINIKDNNGDTAFALAEREGHLHLLKYLNPKVDRLRWKKFLSWGCKH